MASTLPRLPLFDDISRHDPSSTAIVHSSSGRAFTYGQLLRDVSSSRRKLEHEIASGKSLEGERVAFLVENSYDYVVTFLAIRAAQAIAVPLSGSFPAHELRYVLDHSQPAVFLSSEKMQEKADEVTQEGLENKSILASVDKIVESHNDSVDQVELQDLQGEDKGGLMLYTSGTTSRPKGVLLSGSVLTAQARSLIHAWQYGPSDHLLHVLPLHHIHGTMNALLAPLHAGSKIEFLFPFNPESVWHRFAAPFLASSSQSQEQSLPAMPSSLSVPSSPSLNHPQPTTNTPKPITFFTVVPTIYSRLLSTHATLPSPFQEATRHAISPSNLRLAISGSAALPTPTRSAWSTLSNGNTLLERYGMTECGMALSCGLAHSDRVPTSVGWPLPSVQVRLVDTEADPAPADGESIEGNAIIVPGEELDPTTNRERHGEIQLRGPTIFSSYFRNPAATSSEFVPASPHDPDQSPWFKTGDVAVRRSVPGAGLAVDALDAQGTKDASQTWATGPAYFIQGRKSADIIKTGGEKVSALEVERELLACEEVEECAVVGVPSAKWGQKVAAVVVLSEVGKGAKETAGSPRESSDPPGGRVDDGAKKSPGDDKDEESAADDDDDDEDQQQQQAQKKNKKKKKQPKKQWSKHDMRRALKHRLAAYKCPMEMRVVESLPRNAMGKVNKKELVEGVFGDFEAGEKGEGRSPEASSARGAG